MASAHLRLIQRCGLMITEKDGRKAYNEITYPHLAIMACAEVWIGG
jgi:hypothetical protein